MIENSGVFSWEQDWRMDPLIEKERKRYDEILFCAEVRAVGGDSCNYDLVGGSGHKQRRHRGF